MKKGYVAAGVLTLALGYSLPTAKQVSKWLDKGEKIEVKERSAILNIRRNEGECIADLTIDSNSVHLLRSHTFSSNSGIFHRSGGTFWAGNNLRVSTPYTIISPYPGKNFSARVSLYDGEGPFTFTFNLDSKNPNKFYQISATMEVPSFCKK